MNKNILIGSVFVLTLILLLPSIPAIQLNEIKQDYEEINLKDVLNLDLPNKFPLLFCLVNAILLFRAIRVWLLWEFSTEPSEYFPGIYITHTLVFFRWLMLYITTGSWEYIWENISELFGWDWFE